MEMVLNSGNLSDSEITLKSKKVRCLLLDDNDNLLVANYGGVYMLPGGKLDGDEDKTEALNRELKEELGVEYTASEVMFFVDVKSYQKDYPSRDDEVINRCVETSYFIGKYKGVSKEEQSLSEKEVKANFRLELISLSSIMNVVSNNPTENVRNPYFREELLAVCDLFINMYGTSSNVNLEKVFKKV